jgi:hypothetical protein
MSEAIGSTIAALRQRRAEIERLERLERRRLYADYVDILIRDIEGRPAARDADVLPGLVTDLDLAMEEVGRHRDVLARALQYLKQIPKLSTLKPQLEPARARHVEARELLRQARDAEEAAGKAVTHLQSEIYDADRAAAKLDAIRQSHNQFFTHDTELRLLGAEVATIIGEPKPAEQSDPLAPSPRRDKRGR